jgi:hypothetical protein
MLKRVKYDGKNYKFFKMRNFGDGILQFAELGRGIIAR